MMRHHVSRLVVAFLAGVAAGIMYAYRWVQDHWMDLTP